MRVAVRGDGAAAAACFSAAEPSPSPLMAGSVVTAADPGVGVGRKDGMREKAEASTAAFFALAAAMALCRVDPCGRFFTLDKGVPGWASRPLLVGEDAGRFCCSEDNLREASASTLATLTFSFSALAEASIASAARATLAR